MDRLGATAIKRRLGEDGIQISQQTLTSFLGRFRQTGVLSPAPKPPKTRKLDPYCDFIDKLYMNDDELSAKDVQKLLRELHMVDVSISTIKRQRACLGCRFSKPSNTQMVRNVTQEKRLLFCQSLMEEGHVVDKFNHVIFTNETIHLHQNCTISFCKIGEQQPYKIRPKHIAKLHVRAGISRRGATDFLVFKGNMDAEFYCTTQYS